MHRLLVPTLLACLAFAPSRVSADEQRELRRIAFGSCSHQDRDIPIFDTIVNAKPDLFLHLGDLVYIDSKKEEDYPECYKKLAAKPSFQRLKAAVPMRATWDDHEYGWNDAGADWSLKDKSQAYFLDFLGEPADSPRRKQKGVYASELFGPPERRVQILLLDTRYFRDKLTKKKKYVSSEGPYEPSTEPAATMLGKEQWAWLEQQLKVPAKVRIIGSSIQVLAEDHGHEKWANLPAERDRLFKLLADTKANGVIFLSGDRHLGEISMVDAGVGFPIFDITSSGLNQASKKWRKFETNRHRIGTLNWGNHFGVVEIDWARPDPLIKLQLRDEEGDVRLQENIPLSLLQPGAIKVQTSALAKIDGKAFDPASAKKMLGKEVLVEMTVAATGGTTNFTFLNSHSDRMHASNFTIAIDKTGLAGFRAAGVPATKSHFLGKRIQVQGILAEFNGRAQILVSEPKQIEILSK